MNSGNALKELENSIYSPLEYSPLFQKGISSDFFFMFIILLIISSDFQFILPTEPTQFDLEHFTMLVTLLNIRKKIYSFLMIDMSANVNAHCYSLYTSCPFTHLFNIFQLSELKVVLKTGNGCFWLIWVYPVHSK